MGVRPLPLDVTDLTARASSHDIKKITARQLPLDREDAEQEATLRLIQASTRETVAKPVHLLRRIARNLVIDRQRHQQKMVGLDDAPSAAIQICTAPDPELALINSERLNRALVVIQAMPTRRREAFLLHRIDGLSYAQIARRMGVTPKAVEKHMTLAMIDLARGMEKLETPKVG